MYLVAKLWRCLALALFLSAATSHPVWSDTDKTTVDLEKGRPSIPLRYHRPQGAQRYMYDKTEVDLAIPRPAPQPATESQETTQPIPRPVPATLPMTLPPETPLPGGGR